ncbi:MAG TPA: hypothetical protein VMF59_03920 [Bacteroidota bacterium]|nr:hypothetical protein [Bacteroidota bacterium]
MPATKPPKRTVPVMLLVLAPAVLAGLGLVLYGYTQDRPVPLSLGLGLAFVGGFLWVLRIAVWGNPR